VKATLRSPREASERKIPPIGAPFKQTASFSIYAGPGRVSIARWAPKWTARGWRRYQPLVPGVWSRCKQPDGRDGWVDETAFRLGFADQLAALDPQRTWDDLHTLVAPAVPVLLCWERPGSFCHRRLVADWFQEKLGVSVHECGPA